MPNQRAKNKVLVGAFVEVQVKNQLFELARSGGRTVSHVIVEALRAYLARQRDQDKTAVQTGIDESADEIWRL